MFKFLKINRTVVAILAGYAIEKYDMFLYGFFTIIIGELFFPENSFSKNTITPIIFSLGIFSAGYIMRPLGGIFFGYLGDKVGRKKALLISVGLASIPPALVSILPTYAQIGITAPVCLIVGRIFQGFCSGGEFSGASVFFQEYSSPNKVAFLVSLLRSVGFIGIILGTLIAYFSTFPSMPEWCWRIPFLLGAVLTVSLYFLRAKDLVESPAFQTRKESGLIKGFPLIEIFKNSKTRLICAMALTTYASISYYVSTVYMSSLLKTEFNLLNHQIMAVNMGIMFFWVFSIPLLGSWADKLNIRNFIEKAAWWNILLVYPFFWLLEKYFSLINFVFFQIIFGLISASFYAPFAGIIPKVFRVEERYSGVAFSVTFVQAIIGGLTPLICTLLVSFTGDKKAPAYLLMAGAFIGLMGAIKLKDLLVEPALNLNFEKDLEKKAAFI